MNYYITDEDGRRVGQITLDDSSVTPEPEKPSTALPDSLKPKVALVVGHDMDSKGAYGNDGISEFDFNNALLSDLVNILPQNNTYGMFYRTSDISGYTSKMIDLHKRIDKWGADVSVEFHFNSFSDDSINGHEVLYCSEAGKAIAEQLDICFDRNLGNSDRGIKKVTMDSRGGGFCCRGNSKAIICEPFFGAHQKDFCRDGKHREALKQSIIEFLQELTI